MNKERKCQADKFEPYLRGINLWKPDEVQRRLRGCVGLMPELSGAVERIISALDVFPMAADGMIRSRTEPGRSLSVPLSLVWSVNVPANQIVPVLALFNRAAKNVEAAAARSSVRSV